MSKTLYMLATLGESVLSVFGVRSTYDQPSYRVVSTIAPDIEVRAYQPRLVAETAVLDGKEGAAFGRLFGFITGANRAARTIPMTVPVEQAGQRLATTPVEIRSGVATMRFFLPPSIAPADAPAPTDPAVRIVELPAATLGVLRYSGSIGMERRATQTARLRAALDKAGRTVVGEPIFLGYDPPFTLPFLRRNEVALPVTP